MGYRLDAARVTPLVSALYEIDLRTVFDALLVLCEAGLTGSEYELCEAAGELALLELTARGLADVVRLLLTERGGLIEATDPTVSAILTAILFTRYDGPVCALWSSNLVGLESVSA